MMSSKFANSKAALKNTSPWLAMDLENTQLWLAMDLDNTELWLNMMQIPDLLLTYIFIDQKQIITMGPLLLLLFHLNIGKLFQQSLKNCLTLPFTTNINYTF